MLQDWSLARKLIASFLAVACITLVIGTLGYRGAKQAQDSINEIGVVRLPSVQSLLEVQQAQTAVDAAENLLLSREVNLDARRGLYDAMEQAFQKAQTALNVYEPLPQTKEEAEFWRQFVPAWEAWKKDDLEFLRLSKEYDPYIKVMEEAEATFQRLSDQGESVNAKSYDAAKVPLDRIIAMYVPDQHGSASQPAAQPSAPDPVLAWSKTWALLTLRQVQAAIDRSENALLDRSLNSEQRQWAYNDIAAAWKRVEQALPFYEKLPRTVEEATLWNQFLPAWTAWQKGDQDFLRISREYDSDYTNVLKADAIYAKLSDQGLNVTPKSLAVVQELLGKLVKINQQVAADEVTSATRQAEVQETVALAASILGVLLAVGLGLLVSRGIARSIQSIFRGLRTLSARELAETADIFGRIIAGLTESVGQVNDAAGQVAGASQQLAEGASEQASSLEETSSALEEMAAMTRTNAGNAKQANDLAIQARHAADEGEKTMGAISESSGQISKIIKVIEEIAFQTNLLALNAAVEAARAGEHGKGFAVVADEVRNLAQRAAQAARETTGLIENSVNKSKEGTEAIKAIVGNVGKLTELITGISKASDEQAQGVDQVNTAVSQMDKVTQQNASGAEESASAAEELSAQAESVNVLVGELITLVEGDQGGTRAASNATGPTKRTTAVVKPAPIRKPQNREHKPLPAGVGKHGAAETFPLFEDGDQEDLKDF